MNIIKNSRLTAASLLLACSMTGCTETKSTPTPAPTPPPTAEVNADPRNYADYTELVWSDEFAGSSLDGTKWGYDQGGGGWGNNELETYTNSTNNVYLNSGSLVIKAIQSGNSYTSGRILTKGKKDFKFGRIDIRAKVPKGKGIWPAIWMLGSDIDQNNWPRCGEIDIMELRGSRPKELLTTMHFGTAPGGPSTKGQRGITQTQANDLSDAFHVYSIVRSNDQIRIFLDEQQVYSFGRSDASPFAYPFNNPFFMVLNLAVGGDFDGNPDATTTFPQQMEVDYVRYLQYK